MSNPLTDLLPKPLNIPEDAPFSKQQRSFLAGYLAGLTSPLIENDNPETSLNTVHVFYGTQTGNAETLCQDIASSAASFGLQADMRALDDVEIDGLPKMDRILIICSTYGEGEMPDNAEIFWDGLRAADAPRLENTHFAVLALGDTSYDFYCEAGKLLDLRFEQLGAKRIAARVDCDIDYEDVAATWIETILPEISKFGADAPAAGVPVAGIKVKSGKAVSTKSKWNRKNPYAAMIQTNKRLSGSGSAKEIVHYEFSLRDSGIDYHAGDALGVMPVNDAGLVTDIIAALGATPETDIQGQALQDLLLTGLEVSTPNKEFLRALATRAGDDELDRLIANGDKEQIDDFLWSKDTLDLLRLYEAATFSAAEFTDLMKPLQHRAYSIASSPKAAPDAIHLTVATVKYHAQARDHRGVCSGFLQGQEQGHAAAGIFVQPNKNFRLPQDPTTPVIMIGPGTGIAPFRAFLQDRAATGAAGKNWLFFGDQHVEHDYIYQDELQGWQKTGVLTKLDTAFSRDQEQKIYVQHRMMEQAKEIYDWLEQGAAFYVCGDATRMAKDVDQTLHGIIAQESSQGEDAAIDYVTRMKKQKRYLRDVY